MSRNLSFSIIFLTILVFFTADKVWAVGDPPTYLAPNEILIFVAPDVVMNESLFDQGLTGDDELDVLGGTYGCDRVKPLFPNSSPKTLRYGGVVDLSRWYKIRFSEELNVVSIAAAYDLLDETVFAETIHRANSGGFYSGFPNDPEFGTLWHLHQSSDRDIDAPEAWSIETGNSSEIVAIIDSGVNYDIDDFAGNIWNNDQEIPGNGIDDDGNGYIDDIRGWDFVDDNSGRMSCPPFFEPEELDHIGADNDPMDQHGHGTRCASTICCINNNNTTLSAIGGGWGDGTDQSVGNGVKVMPLRVGANFCGVGQDFLAEALYYAAINEARIASISIKTVSSNFLLHALRYYLLDPDQERLIFIAAQNADGAPTDYVQNIGGTLGEYIVTVAATNSNDVKYSQSNYGTVVDLSAPGEAIKMYDFDETLRISSGTSYAAPMSAGVAALVWSRFSSLGALEARDRIFHGAEDIYADNDPMYYGLLGVGRLNAYRALSEFGVLAESTTWGDIDGMPDTIYVSGDLIIASGVTLTINPGTVVKVATEDEEHSTGFGSYPDRVEIIVLGNLELGTSDPGTVVFESCSDSPGPDDWAGICWKSGTSANLPELIIRNASPAVIAEEIGFESDDTNDWKSIYLNTSLALDDTYFVPEDASLYILGNTDVVMHADATNKIEVNGSIIAAGDTALNPVFTSDVELNNDWSGIVLNTSSHDNVLDHVTIKHHLTGILATNTDVEFRHVEFISGVIGIQINQGVTGLIKECTINGHPIGIVSVGSPETEISYCHISGSTTWGIYCLSGADNWLYANEIQNCEIGLHCNASSPLVEWNTIESNGVGVSCINGSNPDLGYGAQGSVGKNSILSNTTHHVVNLSTSVTVMAEYNWWGSSIGPKASKISGAVDYDNPLPAWPGNPPAAFIAGNNYEPAKPEKTPDSFSLADVFPNPFNPLTVINYVVPNSGGTVRIAIFDVNGRLVKTLVDGHRIAGAHSTTWDGTDNQARRVSSGMYFLKMRSADFTETRKLILLR